jgi:hypothetical protein
MHHIEEVFENQYLSAIQVDGHGLYYVGEVQVVEVDRRRRLIRVQQKEKDGQLTKMKVPLANLFTDRNEALSLAAMRSLATAFDGFALAGRHIERAVDLNAAQTFGSRT